MKDPDSITARDWYFSKALTVHPAVNGYPTLFRAGEGEGGEEEECCPISVAPSPVQVGCLPGTSPHGPPINSRQPLRSLVVFEQQLHLVAQPYLRTFVNRPLKH